MKLPSHHIPSKVHIIKMIISLMMLTLTSWLSSVCQVSSMKLLLSSHPLHAAEVGRKSLHSPHFRSGELSLRGRSTYCGILHGRFICSPQLFMYSRFIYIITTSWVFILYFGLIFNTVILSLNLFWLWPLGALSAGSCVALTYDGYYPPFTNGMGN